MFRFGRAELTHSRFGIFEHRMKFVSENGRRFEITERQKINEECDPDGVYYNIDELIPNVSIVNGQCDTNVKELHKKTVGSILNQSPNVIISQLLYNASSSPTDKYIYHSDTLIKNGDKRDTFSVISAENF